LITVIYKQGGNMSTNYILISIRIASVFSVLFFLTACNSDDNGRPNTTTNITVIADLSNVSSLIDSNHDVQAQLEYGESRKRMIFTIEGTAEKTIENYDLASINITVRLTVAVKGIPVELATASRSVNIQAGTLEIINITKYQFLDTDGDGISNLIEITNNSDYDDINSFPAKVNKPTSVSENYSIIRSKISELNYSPSSKTYSISNTSGAIYSVPKGISRTLKQTSGVALYEINTN